MTRAARNGLLTPAGVLVGGALWAAATQAGQILPDASCAWASHPLALLAAPAIVATLAAAAVSWRSARSSSPPDVGRSPAPQSPAPQSQVFVGRVCALAGLLFAFALALQGLSALVLTGCER